jgi:hypothetical protein
MRCGNRIVSDGDQDFQVRDCCGEPFWTDRHANVDVIGAYGPFEQQRSVQFDVWYYKLRPAPADAPPRVSRRPPATRGPPGSRGRSCLDTPKAYLVLSLPRSISTNG